MKALSAVIIHILLVTILKKCVRVTYFLKFYLLMINEI